MTEQIEVKDDAALRETIASQFDHVVVLLRAVETNLAGAQEMVEGFGTLLAQMQHGVKLRGDLLSQRRAAAVKGAQLLGQLRGTVGQNIAAIEAALAEWRR